MVTPGAGGGFLTPANWHARRRVEADARANPASGYLRLL